MKFCFLIPDGVGIRNYLYSDIIKDLTSRSNEVIIWHSLGKPQISQVKEIVGLDFLDYDFIHRPELPIVKFIRETTTYARLKQNVKLKENPTILDNWMPRKIGWKNKLFYKLVEKSALFLNNYHEIHSFEKIGFLQVRKSQAYKESLQFLRKTKPDVLFCTHQRVPSITPAVLAAQDLQIKTFTAVFSWDNLPKARLAFRTDRYLVWSDYMKDELLTYYPEIDENQIDVTSTTQFDFYRKEELIDKRGDFAEKYGLDQDKKWICFSGSDSISSPNDHEYLEDVAEALKNQNNVQLIFREVPVESIDRFKEVLSKFPEIKNISPEWVKSSQWGSFFPLPSDIKLLVNLAYHCDVVINLGSTMALDFAVFGSTAFYLAYDQPHERKRFVKDVYGFEHFKTMNGLDAVGWIRSKDAILPSIHKALSSQGEVGPDKMKWFERVVQPNKTETSSQRIVKALIKN
ncbi:glycosyltransferase family protein [Algoriphagus algorifonticola]|uniref:hypothetical protein n=1 Tax=Algoriphagus algorifonticola TaxID=2593007 RepID=UPI0011AA5C42|nr:hypothetical protein [Algoriphagus algorifonticola]